MWPVVENIVGLAVDHAHEALHGTLTETQAVHLDAAHSLYWRHGQALDTAREDDGSYSPTYLLPLADIADNLAVGGGHQHILLPTSSTSPRHHSDPTTTDWKKLMYVITCPNMACKAPGAELRAVPVPHTDDHVDAALCTKCEKVWGLDPGADGSCSDCGGSGTVGATGPGNPLCPCHESHSSSVQPADQDRTNTADTADTDQSSPPTPSMTWRRTAAVLLATIVAAGIALATGAEVAWSAYQRPADLPGVGADGAPHDRFLWAFFVGAMATIALGSLGGAAVDQIDRCGTASHTWH